MIPREFRAETVAATLAATLDRIRRSRDTAAGRHEAFSRRVEVELDRVEADWRVLATELDLVEAPEEHAAFLRSSMREVFLPRFERAVSAYLDEADRGFGLGRAASPLGRAALGLAGLVLAYLTVRVLRAPWAIPLAMGLLALPGLPELLKTIALSRYRQDVEAALHSLARAQDDAIAERRLPDWSEVLGDAHDVPDGESTGPDTER